MAGSEQALDTTPPARLPRREAEFIHVAPNDRQSLSLPPVPPVSFLFGSSVAGNSISRKLKVADQECHVGKVHTSSKMLMTLRRYTKAVSHQSVFRDK